MLGSVASNGQCGSAWQTLCAQACETDCASSSSRFGPAQIALHSCQGYLGLQLLLKPAQKLKGKLHLQLLWHARLRQLESLLLMLLVSVEMSGLGLMLVLPAWAYQHVVHWQRNQGHC